MHPTTKQSCIDYNIEYRLHKLQILDLNTSRNLIFRVGTAHDRNEEKRVKLFDYYLRKEGISGASILEKTVAERAKNELCIKSWGGDDQNFSSLDIHISL